MSLPQASTSTALPDTVSSSPASTTPSKRKDPTMRSLDGIRSFLESQSCYSILPESYRLIVFDNKLSITKSLQALVTNGESGDLGKPG